MILVTGATGKVGRHLVADLAAAGTPVRALTRNPQSARLPDAAEIAGFDPGQPDEFGALVQGVRAMFINVTAVGAVIDDLMKAAAAGGVQKAVLLSSFTVRDGGAQPYAIGAQHKAIEDVVEASGLDWTFLRCGGFAANSLAWAPSIRQQGVVRAPYGKAATAPIAERDVASAAARVLLDGGHAGVRYVLTGPESLTVAQQAEAIGAAIGRTIRFEELPPDVFRQAAGTHMPAAVVEDFLRYQSQYVGRRAEMSPYLTTLIGRPGTTFADWAAEHAASFR